MGNRKSIYTEIWENCIFIYDRRVYCFLLLSDAYDVELFLGVDEMMKEAIRILHVVTYMGRGGLETMIMNYYRHMDRSKIQFDFLVHRDFEADYDKEILSMGGKIYHISRLVPWSRKYYKK